MIRLLKIDWFALLICLSLALAARLPGLTVFLTADEARSWFGRSIIFLDSLARGDWANTAPGGQVPYLENVSLSPAPGVTTMWAGALGLLWEYARQGMPVSLTEFLPSVPFDPLNPAILIPLRLPGVLVAVLAVGLTYGWGCTLLGRPTAFLAATLLALDPFGLALSRVLGHDSLVSLFMWLSLLAFLRAILPATADWLNPPQPSSILHPLSSSFILLSGVFAGLATLSKYPALSLGLFLAIMMLIVYARQWLTNRHSPTDLNLKSLIFNLLGRWLAAIALWSLAAATVFILLWPAMWFDPLGMPLNILSDALRASGSAHPKGSFFLGQPVPDPGWQFYPLVLLLRTTPVVMIGLILALIYQVQMKNDKLQVKPISLILWAFVIFYMALVTVGGKKQDRYLLPIFPALTTLAAVGYIYLFRLASSLRQPPSNILHLPSPIFYLLSVLLLVLLIQAAFVLPTYPYYFSYYNPLLGGRSAAAHLIQVGWGEGLNEAAAYLNTLPNAKSLKVVSWYSTTFEPYFKGQSIYKIEEDKISRSSKPGLAADYLVFYINQVQRQLPSEGALQFFRTATPVYTVTLNGLDYAWIYPSLRLPYLISNEARLVGQGELLGYTLTTETGIPTASAYPESVVLISMYWEWQGQAADDKLRLSLVDDAGQTRGYGNPIETTAPLPHDQWQDGMVVRDDFALVIFPDTPPGEYHLAAWIERPSTGETIGIYPLGRDVTLPVIPRPEVQP
jgi:hypothetical protein